jgi:hypothetical protein
LTNVEWQNQPISLSISKQGPTPDQEFEGDVSPTTGTG